MMIRLPITIGIKDIKHFIRESFALLIQRLLAINSLIRFYHITSLNIIGGFIYRFNPILQLSLEKSALSELGLFLYLLFMSL